MQSVPIKMQCTSGDANSTLTMICVRDLGINDLVVSANKKYCGSFSGSVRMWCKYLASLIHQMAPVSVLPQYCKLSSIREVLYNFYPLFFPWLHRLCCTFIYLCTPTDAQGCQGEGRELVSFTFFSCAANSKIVLLWHLATNSQAVLQVFCALVCISFWGILKGFDCVLYFAHT